MSTRGGKKAQIPSNQPTIPSAFGMTATTQPTTPPTTQPPTPIPSPSRGLVVGNTQLIKPSLVRMPPKPTRISELIQVAEKFYTDIRQNDPTGVFTQFQQPIDDFKAMVSQAGTATPVRGRRPTAYVNEFEFLYNELKKIYFEYKREYNENFGASIQADIGSDQVTNNTIREWNRYVLFKFAQGDEILERDIPGNIRRRVDDTYINLLDSYNVWLQSKTLFNSTFNFDSSKLLLSLNLEYTPKPQIQVPEGFTEIGVNAFFKKLEGQLANNYSDLMGEYRVAGASPSKLYMDKNYKFVVVQGDKRRVFNDVIEARRFALLGGFDADKVQQLRASKLITNKLSKDVFRVATRVNA